MTERKPAGTSWETWIEQQIRHGMEQGEFDNLPGKGKPLAGLDEAYDEMWWVRRKLQEEGVSYLPPTLAIRKDVEVTLEAVGRMTDEAKVREMLAELNGRIRMVNRTALEGPPSTVMPLDVDDVVDRWRAQRTAPL